MFEKNFSSILYTVHKIIIMCFVQKINFDRLILIIEKKKELVLHSLKRLFKSILTFTVYQ